MGNLILDKLTMRRCLWSGLLLAARPASLLRLRNHLKLHRPRNRINLRLVVFINPRLERARPYRILRTQPKPQLDRLPGPDRIEIQNRLSCRQTELFEPPTMFSCTLRLIILKVLAQEIESRRDTKIDHHHIRGLAEIVMNGCRRRRDIVLREARAII